MSLTSRSSGFIILVIISCILGAVEGSALCYIFSGLNAVWLVITFCFGLVLLGSLVWTYYYFKTVEPYASSGIRPMPSIRPYHGFPSASQENNRDDALHEALKASKYPLERKINILKAIINGLRQNGKVTYKDVYDYLHFLDGSYQENEIKEAFEFLSQPLYVIKQENDGEYKLAVSKNELKERLWLLSQIFLESSTKNALPTKPE